MIVFHRDCGVGQGGKGSRGGGIYIKIQGYVFKGENSKRGECK